MHLCPLVAPEQSQQVTVACLYSTVYLYHGIYFMWQKWQLEETAADIAKCVICNALGKMYLVRMQCSCIAEE